MPSSLTKDQRNLLSRVTQEAREVAETAARAALENLAVHEGEYRGHMTVEQRQLRNRLRARGRALGDRRDERSGGQGIDHLAESAAYEHWHRLLFTRFLAENHLLHTDEEHENVPVTLEECDELAPELGARDGFDLACRFASRTLPGIFRSDDPVLELRLAPNHEVQLRQLLDRMPPEVFRADDALGWTYQFWQAKRKDQINRSGVKVGADELPAVTQLFTEDYMVEFLLHNSIGAWWAGKESARLAPSIETEEKARQTLSLPPKEGLPGIDWTYLRFVRERGRLAPVSKPGAGRPGSFAGQDGPAPFVNPFAEIEITANLLPHWQQGEAWIFVTWRLADSLPADKLRQWEEEKEEWLAAHPQPRDEPTTRDYQERFTRRIEDWLDAGHGACILRQVEAREIVGDALAFFDGQRYELGHWVVMPNHVHLLFRPLAGHRLPEIIHSWKSFTAKEINKLLGRTGPVWQKDYWDRLVRNERHLEACQRYIVENPLKAHLPAGDWSGSVERSGGVPPPVSGRDGPAPFKPAAGTFDGWPRQAAEIRFLDPCMGSGHFLVFALPILARLRMEEEGLGAGEAVSAALRDNLHGLEIDERCTQIAAFNVALTAWRLGGYQQLPPMHLACSGLAPHASKQDWMALADRAKDVVSVPPERDLFGARDNLFTAPLRAGMEGLYDLFCQAPVLGSLIDPRAIGGDLLTADFQQLQPILEQALARETDDNRRELAVTAQGLTKAAEILAGRFTLVATNVPYLARGKQSDVLKRHCETRYPEAKNDLANCFLERCLAFLERGRPAPGEERPGAGRPGSFGTVQLVMPQNWLFLGSYRKQRERLLMDVSWNLLGRLGPGAFETISGEVVNAILLTLSNAPATSDFMLTGLDASGPRSVGDKAAALRRTVVSIIEQQPQLRNVDCRISLVPNDAGAL